MTPMADRLDRFVRWFFNSSPTSHRIEPVAVPPLPASGRVRPPTSTPRRKARQADGRRDRQSTG